MSDISKEPLEPRDHEVSDAAVLTYVEAFAGDYLDIEDEDTERTVQLPAVVLSLTGDTDEEDDVTHRFVIPIEMWGDVNKVVTRAIRSYKLAIALQEAHGNPAAALDELLVDDDGEDPEDEWDRFMSGRTDLDIPDPTSDPEG